MQQQDGHGRIGVLSDNVDPIAYGIEPFDGGGNQTGAFGYLETHPADDDELDTATDAFFVIEKYMSVPDTVEEEKAPVERGFSVIGVPGQ